MADAPQMSNPYQMSSTAFGGANAALTPGQRPGGLIAIAVIAIVLGGFGLFSSVVQLVIAMRSQSETVTAKIPERLAKKMTDAQKKAYLDAEVEGQQKAKAVVHRYRIINLSLASINLLLSAAILAGAILILCLSPLGRSLLLNVFLAAVVFEILRAAVQITMQVDLMTATGDAMRRLFEAMPQADGKNGPQAIEVAKMAAQVGFYIGIGFLTCCAATQAIFYAIGFRYLRRPDIKVLFAPKTTA